MFQKKREGIFFVFHAVDKKYMWVYVYFYCKTVNNKKNEPTNIENKGFLYLQRKCKKQKITVKFSVKRYQRYRVISCRRSSAWIRMRYQVISCSSCRRSSGNQGGAAAHNT